MIKYICFYPETEAALSAVLESFSASAAGPDEIPARVHKTLGQEWRAQFLELVHRAIHLYSINSPWKVYKIMLLRRNVGYVF